MNPKLKRDHGKKTVFLENFLQLQIHPKLLFTCVRAFAFHLMNWSQIQAQYTARTPLFEFWLNKLGSGKKLLKLQNKCYKVSWGGKMTATQSCTMPLSIKGLKEHYFNLFIERGIVEDCVAVILPPQLTLSHLFCNFSNFFPEHSLLSQISNSGVLGVYWAYI